MAFSISKSLYFVQTIHPPISQYQKSRYLRLNLIHMKRIAFAIASLFLIALTSCEKCADCTCTGSWVYDFDPGISAENESIIRNTYNAEFESDYVDKSEEVCSTGRNYDEDIQAYIDEESIDFSDESTVQGLPWSVSGLYRCTCIEQ